MADTQTELRAALAALAPLAKDGDRATIIVGKVTEIRRFPAKDGRPAVAVANISNGEGASCSVKFADSQTTPGQFFEGAFMVQNVGYYREKMQADCVEFA